MIFSGLVAKPTESKASVAIGYITYFFVICGLFTTANQNIQTMIATLVHVWVNPRRIEEFKKATLENHRESVKEPGNLRFDILQDANDPAKFTFYEAYESEEAVAAHKETPHYEKWRDTVANWMAKPREGVKHTIIAPTDKSQW